MSTPYPQAPAPAASAPSNGLAVAGFVVGLVSLLLCLVPILNNVVFFTAIVGLERLLQSKVSLSGAVVVPEQVTEEEVARAMGLA
ncbi:MULTISPECIES: hypothetical protein [Isoptericola]|uniref:Uncharacterized protein n=1 Tax=Isoptericola sediminis TaxID=2733572 RepID=A0A849JWU2_9MICO|nr:MULTISPECIES: hypothetical protein [Isoptericola]MDO8151579.1 hypothetical protein [Isoptericola sp. b408]NNU27786.1 hypothetical protein [Isoptericola sediminis]